MNIVSSEDANLNNERNARRQGGEAIGAGAVTGDEQIIERDSRSGLIEAEDSPASVIRLGRDSSDDDQSGDEQPAALFTQDAAVDYRARWVVVQQGFVDNPRMAVEQGDELVRQVLSSLTQTFSKERAALQAQIGESDKKSTEMLRLALRRYRSFFDRLLSI